MNGKGVASNASGFDPPDISSIETFLVAADTGSLARTAARLDISISTASRRLEKLEDTLGGRLFDRLYSGLELTALGFRTLPHARKVQKSLAKLAQVTQPQDPDHAQSRRVITVGAPEGIGAFWIARFAPAFLDQFPNIILNFQTRSVLGAERKTTPDVTVSVGPPLSSDVVCVASGGMHFVAYDAETMMCDPDLYEHRLAEHVDYVGTSQWIDPSAQALGQKRDFRLRTDSTSFLSTTLRHGSGRALLPNFWHLVVDGLRPVTDSPSGYVPMYISFNSGFAEQSEGRAVIDWLKRVLKMPPWFGNEFLPANSLGPDHLAATDTRILTAISALRHEKAGSTQDEEHTLSQTQLAAS